MTLAVGARPNLVLLAALLAACSVHPAPVSTGLDTPVPEQWAGSAESGSATTRLHREGADWWSSFKDPTLATLISEALDRNQDLHIAATRVEAAQAQARIAGADLGPQVAGDLSAARRRQNFIGFPILGGDVLSSTSTSLGATINISWEADFWRRLRSRAAGAASSLQAAELDYQAARLSLTALTAKAWFAVIETGRQVDVARRTLATRRTTRERIRRRYQAGLSSALELRFSVSDAALAASLVAQRERQADAARRTLQLILYRYPSGTLDDLTVGARLPRLPDPIPVGLPAELVARRPDLAASEARLRAAGYSVVEARRALYPRLTLTGSTGQLSRDLEDLLDSDFSVWSLAGGLLAPLFQSGKLRAAVDLAEAQQQESLADYIRSLLQAFSEVESNLAAERLLAEREEALRVAVREANAALDLAESQYSAGLTNYLAVLESQRQALNSESQLVSVERQRLDVRVDLHLALGGDWLVVAAATGGSGPTSSSREANVR